MKATQFSTLILLFLFKLIFSFSPRQRTVTRGVNKGVKEDFKAALEKQVGGVMRDSGEAIIRKFLIDERDEIMKCLS